MPPTAKVHMAMPRVAVQNAGLRTKPERVVRLNVGASLSAAPRSGSLTKNQKAAAMRTPGNAAMKKGIRQP